MKQTFFKRLFNVKATTSFMILASATLLLHSCSEDNVETNTATDAIENVSFGEEKAMQLNVNGKFKEYIRSVDLIDDKEYKYVIVDPEKNVVNAYTDTNAFQKYDGHASIEAQTNKFKAEATSSAKFPYNSVEEAEQAFMQDMSDILNDKNNSLDNDYSKSVDVNNLLFIFDHNWPNHTNSVLAHFEGGGSFFGFPFDYHYVAKLKIDGIANSAIMHAHISGTSSIVDHPNYNIGTFFGSANETTIQNTDDRTRYLYLYTNINFTGTLYFYVIPKDSSVNIPRRTFRSIGLF